MWTNSKGVSFYKKGKKYYKNTGWLEREISENEYIKELRKEIITITTLYLNYNRQH